MKMDILPISIGAIICFAFCYMVYSITIVSIAQWKDEYKYRNACIEKGGTVVVSYNTLCLINKEIVK